MNTQLIRLPILPVLPLLFVLGTSAKADSFTNTGAMTYPREFSTATLLPSGKVLVVGGWNGAPMQTAELYDPDTGTWSVTTMQTAHYLHTATLLGNGKVLVAGGWSGGSISTTELYDPATQTWTTTGAMVTPRNGHAAALLPDGQVLAAGGDNEAPGVLSSAELYDPNTGKWTLTGAMNSGRRYFLAVLLNTGKVLVEGGGSDDGTSLATAELYDPITKSWTTTGSMNASREFAGAQLLRNGKVLVVGQNNAQYTNCMAELYDPTTEHWTTTIMTFPRYVPAMALLSNGKVLVAGGYDRSGSVSSSSAEVYDPTTETWTATASLNTGRFISAATGLLNGKVLVAGGSDDNGVGHFLSSAELYDFYRITVQPQSQIANWGAGVSFSISVAGGIPPLTYQWRKDGVPIVDATNCPLVLTNVQIFNEGNYTVLVSDAAGNTITSLAARLTVRAAGITIALHPAVTIEGVAGQTYGVQCTTDLSNTNSWVGRTNLTLTTSTQIWYDSQPASQPQRYYRVVPGPISIP